MKKFFMMSLLALVTLVSQAQQNKLKVKTILRQIGWK